MGKDLKSEINKIDYMIQELADTGVQTSEIVLRITHTEFMGRDLIKYYNSVTDNKRRQIIKGLLLGRNRRIAEDIVVELINKTGCSEEKYIINLFKGMADLLTYNMKDNITLIKKMEYGKDFLKQRGLVILLLSFIIAAIEATACIMFVVSKPIALALTVLTLTSLAAVSTALYRGAFDIEIRSRHTRKATNWNQEAK